MTKYLVIANTYPFGYGLDNTLFGIFDTKEEAVQWILNNSIQQHFYGGASFDFFEFYERDKVVGERTLSKEEYAEKYIKEFDGSPLCVGSYVE